jgi:CO/xanthine dehydrogenase FAD-binding subunit
MSRYLRPRSVDEAVDLLSADAALRVVAGGTDVYPGIGDDAPRAAFHDIVRIPGLRGIALEDDEHLGGGWRIGAATTWSDVVRAALPPMFRGLQQAGREVGAIQIQTAATLAGNVVNASPAADGTVALLALDARVEIAARRGRRLGGAVEVRPDGRSRRERRGHPSGRRARDHVLCGHLSAPSPA